MIKHTINKSGNNSRRDFIRTSVTISGAFALGLNPFRGISIARAVSPVSVHKLYAEDVYKGLGYRPTWLPGTPINLGNIGVIEDGIFRPITDLAQLGIHFDVIVDTNQDAIDYSSTNGVSMSFKAGGETNGKFKAITRAEAGVLIEFSRKGAVVLQLRDVSFNRIADQHALSKAMLSSIAIANESNQWQRNWVVITEVARASRATIVVSGSGKSRLELKASGSTVPASLADVSAALSVAMESEISIKVIAKEGLTPLYRGLRVKRDFFWLYDEVIPASAEPPPAKELLGDADPAEDDYYLSPSQ